MLGGSFIPGSLDTFTILAATNLTGAFDNVANGARLDTLGGEGSFLVSHNGTTDTVVLADCAVLGDMDCDGNVDRDDIGDPFVTAATIVRPTRERIDCQGRSGVGPCLHCFQLALVVVVLPATAGLSVERL